MKKNMGLYIDGENYSVKKAQLLFAVVSGIGVLSYARVYGIQNDKSTQAWSRLASERTDLTDIRLYGGPGKNKVDKKIQKDIRHDAKINKCIDIIVIATSDHGYVPIVEEMRSKGKKVVIISGNIISKKLKNACNKCYCL